ncbi:E3 ubiquitin-protein ligase AMFR-like isoform X2 [Coccinella septempunctata]|uniref:E3 ubiquitin-protein ligase AMFR-like isoform X2 n=1 Tax=Coccinella septempunctata TaxID=41139 RepID=UPI001D06634B|nr:E3 ubiquitin-protein ligase AMFR-like isoform X2 [Coccinella septempunctata]
MPIAILDRIPFPNLRAYTSGSVLALSACVFYATQIIKDPNWESVSDDIGSNAQIGFNTTNSSDPDGRTMRKYMGDIFTVLVREPICVWTMINMAFCWLILIGTAIQKLVFGELRVSEQQHLKDKFWNFIFYKFIFVFGIINVQYIDEVLLWCSWFAFLGFLHLLSQLSNDRFEYLSFSPTTPVWSHVKLLVLLGVIFALSGFMLLVAVFVGFFGGINTFAFMSAEVILLSVRTLHIIIKYALHLYDMRHENALPIVPNEESKVWERRGPVIYYTELSFEMIALVIDFVHHLHMLIWSNIFLSMASLVICMQMRYLFQEIQRKYKKHRNYVWVRNHLELNYPMATSAELTENSDNCAVCWEKMESARKLPCGHLFHNTCLLSWLEQDTTCPTCRMALNIQNPAVARIESPDLQMDPPQIVRRQLNHFFHFDGSRYVSWLPSFSVEVSHAQLVRQETMASNSQLDAMARQVQELFPNMPMSVITEDLRSTRSVEQTVENVLDGRLVAPPIFREPETISVRRPTGMIHPSTFSNEDISTKNWEEYTAETVENDDTSSLGSRFSKSSQEREKILQKRKENLIHRARKRFY